MAALLLAVVLLLESFCLPRPCQFAIHIFSDNQALVKRIVKMKSWKTIYPSATLMPEWDLLSIILAFLPRLPSDPIIQHVKGHQDDDAPVLTLPLPAQLNCEADTMATESLEAIPAHIPIIPVYPSAVCQLDVRDATTTRRYQAALRWAAATRRWKPMCSSATPGTKQSMSLSAGPPSTPPAIPRSALGSSRNTATVICQLASRLIEMTQNTLPPARRAVIPARRMLTFCHVVLRPVLSGGNNFSSPWKRNYADFKLGLLSSCFSPQCSPASWKVSLSRRGRVSKPLQQAKRQ
jgi:hypothetical protein